MNRGFVSVAFTAFALLWLAGGLRAAPSATTVDFDRDVRPILATYCYECHGTDKAKGGLKLNEQASAKKELDSGAIAVVAGKPDESELIARIISNDPDEQMPPKGKRVKPAEVAKLRRWIEQGAKWEAHWAFRPIVRHDPPAVKDAKWPRGEIDRFVLARLERDGVAPSPESDKVSLLRRLYYDLIGLPPTPEESQAFLDDASPDGYEKLVDRLLASPHFGERWGRHWLDKARYADSDGFEKDSPRPDAYRFRDWVIKAINDDLPFDRFTIEQLAGDLVAHPTLDQKVATAFHRQTLTNKEGGVDPEQFRVEAVFDRTETTGAVWLGLTVGCARCHNHKYDAITQEEYYKLFAFFNNGEEVNVDVPASPDAEKKYQADLKQHQAKVKELEERIAELKTVSSDAKADAKRAGATADDAVKGEATTVAAKAIAPKADAKAPKVDPKAELAKLEQQLATLKKNAPKSPSMAIRVIGQRTSPRPSHILNRGDFLQPAAPVEPGAIAVLHAFDRRGEDAKKPADRLDLANWLVDEQNPLTARVAANDVWMYLFGVGLVRTPDDFGVRGERPTHPELLDWLADEYRRLGWSRKKLIRAIVTSSTYRQSSAHRADLAEIDPENRLVHRQNRFRVEGEIVRDLTLASSGLLARKIGGPSVFPPMPPDVAALSYANNFKWTESKGEDRYRRGMYTFFKRTAPHPNLMTFDCPDANATVVRRTTSNTPLQSLVMLNNQTFHEAAQSLAKRVLEAKVEAADEARLAHAFRLCIVREPDSSERARFTELLSKARAYYAVNAEDAKKLIGGHQPKGTEPAEAAAWVATLRVLLNMDEFITRS